MSTDPADGPTNGRVTYRDVAEAMARVERDVATGLSRVEGKLDQFISSHSSQHQHEQAEFTRHLTNSAAMGEIGKMIDHRLSIVESDVGHLREWRAEVRGMATLVRFAVGTSLVGVIVSVVTLIQILGG